MQWLITGKCDIPASGVSLGADSYHAGRICSVKHHVSYSCQKPEIERHARKEIEIAAFEGTAEHEVGYSVPRPLKAKRRVRYARQPKCVKQCLTCSIRLSK